MIISERLRLLREQKGLSQGDIEERSGLLRCYVSRVENGHNVPAVETLEKFARALEVPLYQLLYDGPSPPAAAFVGRNGANSEVWGSAGKDERQLAKLIQCLGRMGKRDREVLMALASHIAERRRFRAG